MPVSNLTTIYKEFFIEMKKQTQVKNSEVKIKRVFVVGCQRSGTTWMTLLLAQHPVVTAFQHSKFFHYLSGLEKWWKFKENAQQRPVPILLEDEFYMLCRNFAVDVFNKVAARESAVQVVVDKTPENVRFSDLIINIFPDAYFIHVIRDPRSVFSSLRSAGSWTDRWEFPTRAVDGANFWLNAVNAGRKIGDVTERYLEVRYEALHESGPETLQQIYQWLDLSSDRELCQNALDECKIDKVRTKVKMPTGFFRKGVKESWRQDLTDSDIRIIEYVAQDLMQEFGYEKVGLPLHALPTTVRLQQGLEWLLVRAVRVSRALLRRVRGREYDFPEFIIY